MLRLFLAGLRAGEFDPRLRVHRVRKARGVWGISWASDGRATFEYGDELHPGEPHIHWRRIGDHSEAWCGERFEALERGGEILSHRLMRDPDLVTFLGRRIEGPKPD